MMYDSLHGIMNTMVSQKHILAPERLKNLILSSKYIHSNMISWIHCSNSSMPSQCTCISLNNINETFNNTFPHMSHNPSCLTPYGPHDMPRGTENHNVAYYTYYIGITINCILVWSTAWQLVLQIPLVVRKPECWCEMLSKFGDMCLY